MRKLGIPVPFLVMLLGQAAFIISGVVLFVLGHRQASWLLTTPGSFSWTIAVFSWVVLFDSRRRWPGDPVHRRFLSVITFRRD